MAANKKNVTLRVPQDTYQRFEEYRENHGGISKADAGRRLLEEGLDVEAGSEEETIEHEWADAAERAGWALLAFALGAYIVPAIPELVAGGLAIVAGVLLAAAAIPYFR